MGFVRRHFVVFCIAILVLGWLIFSGFFGWLFAAITLIAAAGLVIHFAAPANNRRHRRTGHAAVIMITALGVLIVWLWFSHTIIGNSIQKVVDNGLNGTTKDMWGAATKTDVPHKYYIALRDTAGFVCSNCDDSDLSEGDEPPVAAAPRVNIPAGTYLEAVRYNWRNGFQSSQTIDLGAPFLPVYAAGSDGVYDTGKVILIPLSAVRQTSHYAEPSPAGAVPLDQALGVAPAPAQAAPTPEPMATTGPAAARSKPHWHPRRAQSPCAQGSAPQFNQKLPR